MSLEKLYNYVRGVMQRNEVCIDSNDKVKMLQLLPLRSTLSGDQSRAIRNVLKNMDRWPIQAQRLELQIISMRLAKMIEFEDAETAHTAPKFHQQEVDYLLRLMDSQESSMMLTGDATQEFWEELRVKINSLERM